jgi:predicted RNA-binding protein YlqC (UPF0109 family)
MKFRDMLAEDLFGPIQLLIDFLKADDHPHTIISKKGLKVLAMKQLLIDLRACDQAKEWAENKTWQEVYNTCHRGDWLLWLFIRTNPDDLQRLTLAKGHCANTVRHLMKDKRSIKAVDIAIAFGEGKATIDELGDAAAADDNDSANDSDVAYYANVAACAAADANYSAVVATYAADAFAAATYNAADFPSNFFAVAHAKEQNQQITADICRKYLPIEIWNIK